MKAALLYGARDFRVEEVAVPPDPQRGEVVIRIGSVGVCGSDLHTYQDGRIGDTVVANPMVLGHEFAGTVAALGAEAYNGFHQPLALGQRVAVEPGKPCWHCDRCEQGDPNLCRHLGFMGLWPDNGALQEYLVVPARNCFPIPDALSMEDGALLEPLGVAIHAADLGKVRIGESVAVIGCGPIGLMILRLAKLSGAKAVYAFDQFGWRLDKAKSWGADEVINITETDAIKALIKANGGHGVDVVFEVAWGGAAVGEAIEMADLGARVVLVGIPGSDRAEFKHSTARRKGLTILMSRRMKHTYPRTIELAVNRSLVLTDLVTHRFDLDHTADAFALNTDYRDGVNKVMVNLE
ncbi:MAG: alcohol dehydrogenase catalytic domain-containing protein [Chloroflexi bacterium]|nr:alcohol dehydrogenase catalytic domain-containing protein [Chloroflexota bacterium]